ncbi:hypothetical protein BS50DRAFT_630258 [Corynespora cassiicola Philippines]|uniref:Uncharacterized protein n=1 Tax=Corynespora cassiicola Philippines TaxID=1448308 RepID=A0A2T2P3D0_CORCC|nr:hypothetical protein BS50DRAFT_630258 [Corynespora cassiicola Philippines]
MERTVKRRRSRDHHNDSSTKWAHLPYLGLEPGALAFDAHVDDIGSKTRQSKFQALNDWLKKKNTSDYLHITDMPKYWNAVLDPPELNLIMQRAFHEDRPAMDVVLNVCRAQGRSFEETKREVLRVEIEQRMRRQMMDIQQFGRGLLHSEKALDYALECKAVNEGAVVAFWKAKHEFEFGEREKIRKLNDLIGAFGFNQELILSRLPGPRSERRAINPMILLPWGLPSHHLRPIDSAVH